jgi:antitoxin component YwqK of YwqJK toxin-antitoxin module
MCNGICPATRWALLGGCAALALVATGCSHEEASTSGQPVADAATHPAPATSTKAGKASAANNAANPDFTDDQILKDIDNQTKQAGPAPKFEKYQDLTIQWDPLPGNPKDPDVAAAAEFKTPRSRQRWKVFSDGSKIRDGKYEEWYRNGQRSILGEYVDDSRQGPWKLWHENGKPCKTENYLNGKLEGKWDVLSDKGLLEQKVSYHDGERNGIWTIYAADGKTPKRQESYKAGVFDGEWIFYSADGKPLTVQRYKNNKVDGEQRIYYPNGNLRLVQEFKDGVADGKETKYAEDGKTVKEKNVYDRGRKISSSTSGIAGGK